MERRLEKEIENQLALPGPTAPAARPAASPATQQPGANPPAPTGQTQVAAAAIQQKAEQPPVTPANPDEFANANSKTHKPQWDKFSRQCIDRRKFPCTLAAHFLRDKTDLFRCWLAQSEDWSKVEVVMQRKAEKVTTNRKEREGTKARDILKKYPKEKAESLMANLKKKGLWYYDPDFEGDEEEIYYYTNSGNKLRNDDVTTEGASVNIRDKGNKELAEALIDPEGGMLASGIQPEVQAATEEGQKNLLEALNSAQVQKAKKAKTEKTEKTEKAEPKTLDELAAAKMEECLKKGAEGRKFAIALESLEYSGDLAKQLFTFSTKMEQVFKRLQELRTKKETDPNLYEKHFTIIEEKLTWYAKAESAAKALQNGLGKPKKGKATKKKEKDDKDEKAGAGDSKDDQKK